MGFQISGLKPNFFDTNSESRIWNNDFSLENQNNYLIQAPSGKGKSSFFRMLCGISFDYQGEIRFNNILLKKAPINTISRLRLENWSLVFQNLGLFSELTLKENLDVSGNFEDCKEKLELLGLSGKENGIAYQLSYGERQRLAIIKALNKNYDFLIMDEPFSHLDSALKEKAIELIENDVKSKNASLIILDLEDSPVYNSYQKIIL